MKETQIQKQFFIRLKEANMRENKIKFEVLTECEMVDCYNELKKEDPNILNKIFNYLDSADFVIAMLKIYFSRKEIIDKFKQKFIELMKELDHYDTLGICEKEVKVELENVDFSEDGKILLTYVATL